MKSLVIILTLLFSSIILGQGGDYDVFPKPYTKTSPKPWIIGKGIREYWKWEKTNSQDSMAMGYCFISTDHRLLKHSYFDEKDASIYSYNEFGDWIKLKMQNGKIYNRLIEYNKFNQILSVKCPEDNNYNFTVVYDEKNRPIKKTSGSKTFYWTYFANDSIETYRTVGVWENGIPTSEEVKSFRRYSYSPNRITYIQTDSVGKKEIEVDSIIVDFNERGQQISHIGYLGIHDQNYKSYVLTTYDDSGNTLKTEFDGGRTIWFYDENGLIKKIELHLENGEKRETLFYYEFY